MAEKDEQAVNDELKAEELSSESMNDVAGGAQGVPGGVKVNGLKCPACWSRDIYRIHTFSTVGPYQCATCGLEFDTKK